MTVTPNSLLRAAGIAAATSGAVFIGVQVGHPHLDATSVATTEMVVRNSLKVLMAVLALVGITGMYLRQVRETGVLGLVGYLLSGVAYLLITSTSFMAAYALPELAGRDPRYVDQVLSVATGRGSIGDIGILQTAFTVQNLSYLAAGLVFGIALYRAGVLARWAAALLAVGGLVTIALAAMPDAFYRLLAFPNGIAMIVLGYSLWQSARTDSTTVPVAVDGPRVVAAGAE